MNGELQNALVEFVAMITSAAQTAAGFGAEQLPEVIEQLLMWSAIDSAAWFLLGAMLFCNSILALLWERGIFSPLIQRARKTRSDAEDAYKAGESWTRFSGTSIKSLQYDAIMVRCAIYDGGTIYAGFSVIGLLISMSNLDWLKIIIAPKVWLIEYAAGLVK